jgi:hypothetical protein
VTAEAWAELPESARKTLRWLAEQWRDGFDGDILLRCRSGGVYEVRPTPILHPDNFDLTERVSERKLVS